jgi:UDP-N-acetylmuramoylalanine--D-glutamate ligase
LNACAEVLARQCRLVICIGESGPAFARAACSTETPDAHGKVCSAKGLLDAVLRARAAASPGDAVLFSPGAPSFDAYANFADRGRHFLDIVNSLS